MKELTEMQKKHFDRTLLTLTAAEIDYTREFMRRTPGLDMFGPEGLAAIMKYLNPDEFAKMVNQ